MATKKERKICKVCGVKTIVTKLLFFDNNFYHKECLGSQFEKCPITNDFLPKWKQDFYNQMRIIAPMTFELYIQSKKEN